MNDASSAKLNKTGFAEAVRDTYCEEILSYETSDLTAYKAVERGDLRGMSYAFTVPEGGDSYDPKTNTRTITRIAKVYECSLTAFPAYEATTVSAESRDSRRLLCGLMEKRNDAKKLINQILKVRF